MSILIKEQAKVKGRKLKIICGRGECLTPFKPFSGKELAGKIWVADFIYTTCTGPCPMMSARMRRVQTGFVRSYALSMFVGAVLLVGAFLLVRV